MPQGVKTDFQTELEFRKHYLVTGNASAAARAVGLAPNTGCDLAARAKLDPDFVKARESMCARALEDVERMVISGLEIALERLNEEPPSAEKLAELGCQKVSIQDAGPHYLRGLVAGFDALTRNRRLSAEIKGEISGQSSVSITVQPTPEAAEKIAEEPEPDGGSET